jgi:hypothetical protein
MLQYAVAGGKLLGGFFGKKAKKQEAKARMAIARYNAASIRQDAAEAAEALEVESRKLYRNQREFFAQQFMNIASRGGRVEELPTGGDLGLVLDGLELAQLDVLERVRQRDLILARGENEANKVMYEGQLGAITAKAQGRAAMAQGITSAAGTFI